VVTLPKKAKTTAPAPGMVESYRQRLEAAERLDSPEGAHVMLLAEMLAAGNHTASGAASLSRELRSALEDALRGAPRAADGFDELASRRRERTAGA